MVEVTNARDRGDGGEASDDKWLDMAWVDSSDGAIIMLEWIKWFGIGDTGSVGGIFCE